MSKYNLYNYCFVNKTLSNKMAEKFLKCKKWQDFEKYLILIKVFRLFKKIFKKKGYYNI